MRKLAMMLIACCVFITQALAQNKTVTGKVTDESGAGISGASVTAKGTRVGTTTTQDGTFTLSLPASATTLTISYAGYTSQDVNISGRTSVDIRLLPGSSSLEDVIVTGLTSTKKSRYAGAASVVSKEKINFVPNASFDQILQGRAPGLLVTVGSGQPGSSARVQIRGQSSISGGSGPLYVLDGMPLEDGVFQSLNPNDFEDVQVLRDASATALYGNRGGSGVIVVTSKKGRSGKAVLGYTFQSGVTQPGTQKFEMMNSAELLQFQEKLGVLTGANLPGYQYSQLNPANAGLTPGQIAANAALLDSLRRINTDWQDVFTRSGTFQSHDLNLSGGSGNTRFYVSGAYYDEDGIGLRSDIKRYTLRANLDVKTDKFTGAFNTSVGYSRRNFVESENSITLANPFAAAYLALPYHSLYVPSGPSAGKISVGSGRVGPNALDRVNNSTSFNDQLKANLAYRADYNLTKNFFIGGFAGVDFRQTFSERSQFPNTYAVNNSAFPVGPQRLTASDTIGRGSFAKTYNNFFQYVVRVNAGFKKVFAEKHDMSIQAISEYTDERTNGFNYTAYGINPKLLNTPAGITQGTIANNLIPPVGGFKSARRLYAGILTGVYTFDERYTLNATVRRDASTQLLPEERWKTFYSVGATWNVLKEKFTGNWTKVSDLRLRASYGTTANADGFYFGDFGNRPLYGNGTYAGLYQTNLLINAGNPQITWEVIATANAGIDFGLFKNRITGSVDIYHKKTSDNIITQTLDVTAGQGVGGSIPVNQGTLVNKGIEVNLNGDVIRNKDFTWSVGGNIAYNHNEVTSLGQVTEFEQGTELVKVGKPLGTHYITKWGGVDAATGSPLYYTLDGKLTTTYSDDYRVSEFGTYNAPWIGGFNTSVRYKGFSASALFTFQKGFSRFNNQDYFQLNHAFAVQGFNMRKEMATMWGKPADVTDIQSPIYARQFVSKDIQDASFLRFRNLNISYDLGTKLLNPLKVVNTLKIYAQAQNLYTWTEWTGFDPEDNNNIASYEYPTPRTLTLGVTVGFK
jgi:TonB-linked SusC/RagA family outer membrane protein